MIKNSTLLLVLAFTLSTSSFAQTPLSYHQGFDTAFASNGWQAYRKGITTSYNWSNSSFHPYAGDGFMFHDYPVGSPGTDTTVDWYVSPAFNFTAGGRIDSVHVNIYTISQLTPVDFFGVYLLSGSQDPAAATSITLLADLTYKASSSDTWSDTGHITIPPTAGNSYIAFKYRATQNWFTIGLDELYVTRNAAAGFVPITIEKTILYPNPSSGTIQIKGLERNESAALYIYNQSGKEVETQSVRAGQTITLHLPDGVYLYKVLNSGHLADSGKLVIKN